MRRIYLLTWVTFLTTLTACVSTTYAQTFCAFDSIRSIINHKYPAIAQSIADNETQLKQIIFQSRKQSAPSKKEMTVYTIPVVVHILHTGGDIGTIYNPDTTQIFDAIDYLNDVFSGKSVFLTPAGTDAAGNIGVRFALAKRDPDCNPTNGIHRINMSPNQNYIEYGAIYDDVSADIAMKSPVVWDRSRYYNIYVVNKINGTNAGEAPSIAGYAYLPGNSVIDGMVILASEMKAGSVTLVHEMGHALNLYHPFEGSSLNTQCPVGDNDMVEDTDPISFNGDEYGTIDFSCRTGLNSCNNNLPFNIRTENNFMNYTACNTLFTPGQRERMRASLLLSTRKTLITSTAAIPTYASPACAPKINFTNDAAEFERDFSGTIACRKYKDYAVFLSIGSQPSKNVNVEIQVEPGSDAIENIDYSFPAGKKVTFPAGTNNLQAFKIRVFGNDNIDGIRMLKLGFSLAHGDEPFKGTACTTMDIQILPSDNRPVVPGTVARTQVGKHDENIYDIRIFDERVHNQKTQILYRADELTKAGIDAGNITGIHFFLQKRTKKPFKNINIKIANTAYTELVNNGQLNTISNLTPVATLPLYNTVNGWNNFAFSTAFSWNGTNNIVVELCIDNEADDDPDFDDIYAYSDTGNTERGNTVYAIDEDCSAPLSSISYYSRGIRPVIKFDHIKTGNPIENTITVSTTEYLAPYDNAYLYDNSSPKKIIAKIKNLTDWDYGCINIKIDRSGNGALPFWNNINSQFLAQKTFIITTERNNPKGKYELTLYYTGQEKTGFENGTGTKWENIKLVQAGVPINTITPQNPQSDKVQIIKVNRITPYGTGYAVSTLLNADFAAYGIGFASTVALLVEWGNIYASVVNGNVALHWETISEKNTDHFEIEKSSDGIHFEVIGKVNAQGNSNAVSNYRYIHVNPVDEGTVYYRVKEVDKDGESTYSKTVHVSINPPNSKPYIYPVPAYDNIVINFGEEILKPVIEIYSADMKLLGVYRKNGRISREVINIHHLTSGLYIARITAGYKQYALRFIKY